MIRIIFALLVFLNCFTSNESNAAGFECIAANDFGLGGFIYVPANPNEGHSSQLLLKSNMLEEPKGIQIAPWVETPLYTTGASAVGSDGITIQRAKIKMYIDGRWYPFGRLDPDAVLGLSTDEKDSLKAISSQAVGNDCSRDSELPKCEIIDCTPTYDALANKSVCLPGDGKKIDLGGPLRTKVPCCIDQGFGLYGLIAIERNDKSNNPNDSKDPEISRTPPTSDFRTFHVYNDDLKTDENGTFFELDLSKQCFVNSAKEKVCLFDENQDGNGIVLRGRLYFKINDTYYNDNTGYYSLNIISGVYKKMGFVERTVKTFEVQTKLVSQGMFQLITRDVNFIGMIQALLVLYIALFGVMFSMGMVQINQSELVVRLLKLGIIATLISETSFEFFNTYLFSLFSELGKEVSQIIYDSTLFYSSESINPKFILPDNATPLSIYDVLIDMLLSRSLHMKIWGVLFTKYCWYIPFLYVALVYTFMGIIRSVVTYVTSLVLVAVLLVTGPIFLTMMLFKITQEFFDGWMKLLFAGAMMMMVVAAALAITITLFMNQVENLFSYSVCYQFIYRVITDDPGLCFFGICPLSWFDINFWYPNDMFQVSNNLNARNFFAFLFIGVLFNKIMENIPQLIDTLANNNLRPFSSFAGGVQSAFMQSSAMSAVNYARAVPMYVLKDNAAVQAFATKSRAGRGLTKAINKVTDSKAGKLVKGVGSVATVASQAPEYIDKATHADPLIDSRQGTWGDTLKGSTAGAAKEAKESFNKAKDNKWYKQ